MKILIIGCGVIGTIYGYVLKKADISVTHYVRESKVDKYKNGIALKLLDGRKNKSGIEVNDIYHPKRRRRLCERLSPVT